MKVVGQFVFRERKDRERFAVNLKRSNVILVKGKGDVPQIVVKRSGGDVWYKPYEGKQPSRNLRAERGEWGHDEHRPDVKRTKIHNVVGIAARRAR